MAPVAKFAASYRDVGIPDVQEAESVYHVNTVSRKSVRAAPVCPDSVTSAGDFPARFSKSQTSLKQHACNGHTALLPGTMHYPHRKLFSGNSGSCQSAASQASVDSTESGENFQVADRAPVDRLPLLYSVEALAGVV